MNRVFALVVVGHIRVFAGQMSSCHLHDGVFAIALQSVPTGTIEDPDVVAVRSVDGFVSDRPTRANRSPQSLLRTGHGPGKPWANSDLPI